MKRDKILPPPITKDDLSIEYITPEIAQSFLDNQRKNRKVKNNVLNKLIADINNGTWFMNGATIAFDKDGKMGDGQHRCLAIIKTSKPQWCIIVRNICEEAFNTIDTGTTRTISDVFNFNDVKNYNITAGIVKTYLGIVNGELRTSDDSNTISSSNSGQSAQYLLDVYQKDRKNFDYAVLIARSKYDKKKLLRPSLIGAIVYYLLVNKKHKEEDIEAFFNQLFVVRDSEMNVINLLKDRLEDDKVRRIKRSANCLMAYIAKAWNAYLTKNDMRRLLYDEKKEGKIDFL